MPHSQASVILLNWVLARGSRHKASVVLKLVTLPEPRKATLPGKPDFAFLVPRSGADDALQTQHSPRHSPCRVINLFDNPFRFLSQQTSLNPARALMLHPKVSSWCPLGAHSETTNTTPKCQHVPWRTWAGLALHRTSAQS